MAGKRQHDIDLMIAQRIRMRRLVVGLSQEKLAEALGLTFQQVQKYEKGVNRVSAGRLWLIAQRLNVPVTYFYEELGDIGLKDDTDELKLCKSFQTREGVELNRTFAAIKNGTVRKHVLALMRGLAEGSAA